MNDTQPKAWLCKHCGERVDPTMGLCWNCGCDRQGEQIVDTPDPLSPDFTVQRSPFLNAIRNPWWVFRLVLVAWAATGILLMLTGVGPIVDRWHRHGTPAEQLVVLFFYASILLTIYLIANLIVLGTRSDDLPTEPDAGVSSPPWVRRWMTRGWGSVLFWLAWGWLLLSYL